jgi:hypothetical protein
MGSYQSSERRSSNWRVQRVSSVFAGEGGVLFDEEAGTFTTHRRSSCEIALLGEGLRHDGHAALERNGYRVTSSARLLLRVTRLQDRQVWELRNEARIEERSIEEVLSLPKASPL